MACLPPSPIGAGGGQAASAQYNLGMLYVRGRGVTENKVAGVALLIVPATLDPSPENHAKRNISATRDLMTEMIAVAQTLAEELSDATNLQGTMFAVIFANLWTRGKRRPTSIVLLPAIAVGLLVGNTIVWPKVTL